MQRATAAGARTLSLASLSAPRSSSSCTPSSRCHSTAVCSGVSLICTQRVSSAPQCRARACEPTHVCAHVVFGVRVRAAVQQHPRALQLVVLHSPVQRRPAFLRATAQSALQRHASALKPASRRNKTPRGTEASTPTERTRARGEQAVRSTAPQPTECAAPRSKAREARTLLLELASAPRSRSSSAHSGWPCITAKSRGVAPLCAQRHKSAARSATPSQRRAQTRPNDGPAHRGFAVHHGAALQQQLHHRRLAVLSGHVQQRLGVLCAAATRVSTAHRRCVQQLCVQRGRYAAPGRPWCTRC